MVATAKAAAKKPTAAKKKAAKRKSRPAAQQKTPIAKKLAVTGKAGGNGSGARAKSTAGYGDRPAVAKKVASHCQQKSS